jgi:hypothetical protein
VQLDDPPSVRSVMHGILGSATVLAVLALIVVLIATRQMPWRLVALTLSLWGAYGFFDALTGGVVEPLGRFFQGQLAGGDMPAETRITIEQETTLLERLLAADPPPSAHRAALAGIRLGEIYRTHEHAPEKAAALLARLAARYPDAPELAQSQRVADGGIVPGALITIDQETAALERLIDATPLPSAHQAALAGIRLAEIYRTHEHAPEKAEALLGRLAARYPDALELAAARHARPG